MIDIRPTQGNCAPYCALLRTDQEDGFYVVPPHISELLNSNPNVCSDCLVEFTPLDGAEVSPLEAHPINKNYEDTQAKWRLVCTLCHAQRVPFAILKAGKASLILEPKLEGYFSQVIWPLMSVINTENHRDYSGALQTYMSYESEKSSATLLIKTMSGESVNNVGGTKGQAKANEVNELIGSYLQTVYARSHGSPYTHLIKGLHLLPKSHDLATQSVWLAKNTFSQHESTRWVANA